MTTKSIQLTRRRFVAATSGGLVAAAGLAAVSRRAKADPADAEKMISDLVDGAQVQDGKVDLDLPQIAENGNTVPFTVTVDSPMTPDNHVKAVHVVAEENPRPGVASFYFTPDSGKAEVSMRMRLLKTQNIRAVAVMNDGSVWGTRKNVKVTIGGCGG